MRRSPLLLLPLLAGCPYADAVLSSPELGYAPQTFTMDLQGLDWTEASYVGGAHPPWWAAMGGERFERRLTPDQPTMHWYGQHCNHGTLDVTLADGRVLELRFYQSHHDHVNHQQLVGRVVEGVLTLDRRGSRDVEGETRSLGENTVDLGDDWQTVEVFLGGP